MLLLETGLDLESIYTLYKSLFFWIFLAISYLLGAIPFGFLIGNIFYKTDIRKHGSGNIGASNALRILGNLAGSLTLILDIAKTVVVILTAFYFFDSTLVAFLAGIMSLIGHTVSIFLKLKGGKGMACLWGILFLFDIRIFSILAVIGLVVLVAARSTKSLPVAGIVSTVVLILLPFIGYLLRSLDSFLVITSLLSIYLLFLHRQNIDDILSSFSGKSFK